MPRSVLIDSISVLALTIKESGTDHELKRCLLKLSPFVFAFTGTVRGYSANGFVLDEANFRLGAERLAEAAFAAFGTVTTGNWHLEMEGFPRARREDVILIDTEYKMV
jgi:hypothetical protein